MIKVNSAPPGQLWIIALFSLTATWFFAGTTLFINGQVFLGLASFLFPPLTLYSGFLAGWAIGFMHFLAFMAVITLFTIELLFDKSLPKRNPYYSSIL